MILNTFYTPSSKLKFIFGLSNRYTNKIKRNLDIPSISEVNDINYLDPDKPINIFSLLVEGRYKFANGKFDILAGVRLEDMSDYDIISENGSLNDSLRLIKVKKDTFPTIENTPQFIPRIAGIYHINSTNTLKLIYSQSKKRASFIDNLNALNNQAFNENNILTFADMSTYEVNYLNALSTYLSLNLSLYYNQLSNLIVRTIVTQQNQTSLLISNKGKMNTLGGEATVKLRPNKNIALDMSIVYQETEDNTNGLDTLDMGLSPNLLGYLKVSYFPIPDLSIALKGNYVSEMLAAWNVESGARYGEKTSDYLLLSANIRYEYKDKYFLNLYGSNLLNQEIRYPTNQNSPWMDRGMLGFETRIKLTAGIKF